MLGGASKCLWFPTSFQPSRVGTVLYCWSRVNFLCSTLYCVSPDITGSHSGTGADENSKQLTNLLVCMIPREVSS